MPLYRFRSDYDGLMCEDDVGEVFSTLAEAVAHASVVATELSRNNTRSIDVSVVDEKGAIVAEGRDAAIRLHKALRSVRVEQPIMPGTPQCKSRRI
jgi:hypothetical protein